MSVGTPFFGELIGADRLTAFSVNRAPQESTRSLERATNDQQHSPFLSLFLASTSKHRHSIHITLYGLPASSNSVHTTMSSPQQRAHPSVISQEMAGNGNAADPAPVQPPSNQPGPRPHRPPSNERNEEAEPTVPTSNTSKQRKPRGTSPTVPANPAAMSARLRGTFPPQQQSIRPPKPPQSPLSLASRSFLLYALLPQRIRSAASPSATL